MAGEGSTAPRSLPPPAAASADGASMPRDKVIMECTECKNRNYFTTKNRRQHPERVEWKKYCPRCNAHRMHKESK